MLQEIGAVNPYKSGYKTKEDIQPTSEVAKNLTVNVDGGWQEMNHIEKVDYLRTEIESLIQSECLYVMSNTRLEALARGNTYQHLCEAKFQLGFELQRIKEEK